MKESLQRMGALLPMNIFLRQEIDRIKKVIGIVQKTLCDLKLAIDGTIVMSQGLRESLDAMYDARIPQKWQKVSTQRRASDYSFSGSTFYGAYRQRVLKFRRSRMLTRVCHRCLGSRPPSGFGSPSCWNATTNSENG